MGRAGIDRKAGWGAFKIFDNDHPSSRRIGKGRNFECRELSASKLMRLRSTHGIVRRPGRAGEAAELDDNS